MRPSICFMLLLISTHGLAAIADAEEQAWAAVQAANSSVAYEAYLTEFPKGRYAGPARVKLAILRESGTTQPLPVSAPSKITPVSTVAMPDRPAVQNWGISEQDLSILAGVGLLNKAGFPQRRSEVLRAAESGDALAQLLIGISYEQGVGTFKDDNLKTQWFKKAAEQGLPRARAAYAMYQILGEGTPTDQGGGWNTLMQVARSGNAVAQFNASMFILRGQLSEHGIVKLNFMDRNSALSMLLQSAKAGMGYAQYALGHAYMVGTDEIVHQNTNQARYWLSQAAAQNIAEASSDLTILPRYEKEAASSSNDTGLKLGILAGMAAIAGSSGIPLDKQVNVLSAVGTDLFSNGKTQATSDLLATEQNNAAMAAAARNSSNNTASNRNPINNTNPTVALNNTAKACNTQVGAIVNLSSKQEFTKTSESCKAIAPQGFVWGTDSGDSHGSAEGSCKKALHEAYDGKYARTACYCYQANDAAASSAISSGDWICWVGEGG